MHKILFIGPQGSGKTTQAKVLAEYFSVPLISFGELLRVLSKKDTIQAKTLREDMAAGRLVDDSVAAQVMEERVSQEDCQNGFVSDGYARSLHQLSIFDPQFDLVICLEISDQEVVNRLLKRASIEGRIDDTLEAIKVRLASYHDFTEPVLDHYLKLGILHKISAAGDVLEIQQKIRKVVENT